MTAPHCAVSDHYGDASELSQKCPKKHVEGRIPVTGRGSGRARGRGSNRVSRQEGRVAESVQYYHNFEG